MTSWADQVVREQEGYTDIDEDAGVKSVVEYVEKDGKRYKVTKTYRLIKKCIPKGVIARRSWKKFGDADGGEPCTSEFQDVRMEFISGTQSSRQEDEEMVDPGNFGNLSQAAVIKCQYCKGPHYSVKCPLKSLVMDIQSKTVTPSANAQATPTAPSAPGAYVPPAARSGGRTATSSGIGNFSSRDELPTLRISNLTDNATEEDLRELVQKISGTSQIKRIHIPKDYDKKRSRGFAYISFEHYSDAEKVLAVLNGMKYDHLVLHVEWAKK